MKKIRLLLLLMLMWQFVFASENEEFRATWVIVSTHINPDLTVEQNKARALKILDDHVEANMNAVLWQARQSGTAYFNSSFEPWGSNANYQYPGYDPLAFAIEEAHKRGLELHAWFNVFHTASTHPGTPVAEHPEWVCRDRDGNPMTSSFALSPGLAAVREYTINVAMEIVRNYDIDGFHLDYVRWNEFSTSSQPGPLGKMNNSIDGIDRMLTDEEAEYLVNNFSGRYLYDVEHPYAAGIPDSVNGGQFPSWEDWWRWSVTEFVRVLHDSIQAIKPWVRLSPAAVGKYNWESYQGYGGAGGVYQDAALWFNEGYIDQLTPMHYHWRSAAEFYSILEGGCPKCWGEFIQPGIEAGRLFSVGPGSSYLAADNLWSNHTGIVKKCREVEWVDGYQFFAYRNWRDYEYFDDAKELFFNRKTKIRATKLFVATNPDAPTIILNKIDSLHYEISVTPAAAITTDHRFIIYRSEDNIINVDEDEIIDIHFGKESYNFTDVITGLQDFNGVYQYAATTLDRYWNESEISNIVASEPIPSFAPTVVSTIPASGDTIPVNNSIIIHFSKTMNIASLENSITFEPAIAIESLSWSDDQKTLTVSKTGNFEFATDYTMTIQPAAQDINGKQLDGNNDGHGGDAYVLHFRSRDVDKTGPVVTYTYPEASASVENFDVEDVITLIFDELIDEESVTDTTLLLSQANDVIESRFLISSVADVSLISFKSTEPLLPATEYNVFLHPTVTDTFGNQMKNDVQFKFTTTNISYDEENIIDDFATVGNWKTPDYSGSTVGIIVSGTSFSTTQSVYLPGSAKTPIQKRCACLEYQWSETSDLGYLIREYLAEGDPRAVEFDTTYILQCYIYGDGSYNRFRFAIDEAVRNNWQDHEVSQWVTIDWYGWRLIEWDLGDPNSVGSWISTNSILDGNKYRIDSIQLTHDESGKMSGRLYFDNLRIVKKSSSDIGIKDSAPLLAKSFRLMQNYPNPFNPTTTIPFVLSKDGAVILKVFDVLGREIKTLVNTRIKAGHHEVIFDGSEFASGIYFYQLNFNGQVFKKRMLLLK